MDELEEEREREPEEEEIEENGRINKDSEFQPHRFSKSKYNRIVFGVCGGLGEFFSIEPVFFRLMFLFFILLGGWGIIFYLIIALLMPRSRDDKEIDEEELEAIKKSNGISLIAGIVLLAGLYIIFNDLGYFNFLSQLGIPTEFILAVTIGAIIFFVFSFHSGIKEEKELPAKFLRSKKDSLLGGVCSGLADYLGTSHNTVRLTTVILTFITLGIPVILYILFYITVPQENNYEA